jgi:hypothetical protein
MSPHGRNRSRAAALLAAAFACAGCSQATEVTLEQAWGEPLAVPVKVSYDGREVAAGRPAEVKTFKIPAERPKKSLCRVQVLTPDGWADCTVNVATEAARNSLSFQPPPLTRLWFDNQGGPEAELACGEVRLPIPADRAGSLAFPSPARAAVPLRLGGKEVGTVEPFPKKANYLLDPSGKHSYRLRLLNYAPGAQAEFFAGNPEFGPKELGTYANAVLHALPQQVDYFLHPAPKTIRGGPDDVLKTELLRVK